MDGWMDRWIYVCMDRWIDVCMYGWMGRWMDGQMDGWMDGWMDVRMGGWIERQLESLWCRLRVSQPQRCCRLAWAALMWGILGTTGCGAAALVSTHHVPGAPLPRS